MAVAIAYAVQQATALITPAPWFYSQDGKPLVVGHRGSLGHFPEHTIAGYTDAWLLGVDWVELDLQMTSDGHLIANHDECLMSSTDAELYNGLWSKRKQSHTFTPSLNSCTNDYIIPYFTLAECKMVKRRQRFDYRSTALDGLFDIPTFEEAIEHMTFLKTNYKRKVGTSTTPGLYIELKEPEYYLNEFGIDIGQAVFDVLQKYGLETIQGATDAGIPIIIQSFDEPALRNFATISDLPLVQLMYHGKPGVTYDFDNIAEYAHGVGPDS